MGTLIEGWDRRRLVLLFAASAVFSLMVFFTLYALFMKDMDMGFMRQPDVAPEVQLQQQAEVTPSKEEEYVENTYGPTAEEQGANSTQITPGLTDAPSPASPKVETPAKVSTPSSETKKTSLPAVSSTDSTLHGPKTSPSQAIKPPSSRPRPVALPIPPVPAEEPLAPPVPGNAE